MIPNGGSAPPVVSSRARSVSVLKRSVSSLWFAAITSNEAKIACFC